METKNLLLIASFVIAAGLVAFGLMLGDAGTLGNLIIIAAFVLTGPYFLHSYSKLMWIKSIEQQFPNFIRDISDSIRSGMSFPEAIRISTKSHYGKLTPEIQLMNNRLSWGTPFLRVLEIFGERVKDSKMIAEAIGIIKQSYGSGGKVSSTLDSVSRDMIMLKEAEAERGSVVRQHVMIMYGIFFLFLGIAIMIIYVMVPMITSQVEIDPEARFGMGGFTNPCCPQSCRPSCEPQCVSSSSAIFPCSYFSMICSVFGVEEGLGCYYLALFFTVVLIEGIFTGLIAGQLGSNSVVAGTKHSMIMVLSAIGIFMFITKVGLLVI